MKIIGIDIGTTSVCGVVADPEQGMLLRSVTLANDSMIPSQDKFSRFQNPERIFEVCSRIYQDFIKEFSDINAIGFTGQMHGIVYLDQSGNPVSPLYTWQDGRGREKYDDTKTYAQELSQRTGYNMATGFGLTTAFYNRQKGLEPDNAAKICTIHDFVAMKFCGKTSPIQHSSDAASFGLFDLKSLRFDMRAVQKTQCSEDLLPLVSAKFCFIGETQEHIPVCIAIGDNQASVLGSMCENGILVNVGTGSQVSVLCDRYLPAEGVEYRPFSDDKYLMTGCALAGGYSYSLLKNFFLQTFAMFGVPLPDNVYDKMNAAALSVKNTSDHIHCVPYFCGTREDPDLRASFQNISADNFSPEQLTLSVLKGICEELYQLYENFRPLLKTQPAKLVGSGNGIRKNALLSKIFSERFQMPLLIPRYEEEAAFGCALSAYAVLKNKSVTQIQSLIQYQ